jgi:DNA-binding transcriptional regulator YdaS (Cro superfamily)
MADTPLRQHLQTIGMTAEEFAANHSLSPWNVRHWSRGDKEPSLSSQLEIEAATGGAVRPSDWLEWRLAKSAGKAAA